MGGCVFSQASLLQAATSGSSDGGGGETSKGGIQYIPYKDITAADE